MKAKILLVAVLAIVMNSGCQDQKQEIINRFENNLNEHSFAEEGIHSTGKKSSIQSRMAHYKAPGLSLSIINDYKIDWQRSYGFLEAGKADMVDGNSIFQAGSVSKFVTALVVMHYVEAGVFDLDADVNSYLKSWKMPRNEFTGNKAVTLRLLLSHQSGLPSSNMDRDESRSLPSLVQILDAEPPAINKPAIPEFTPGSKWSYSNIGYVVIQLVLEDTLGRSLDELASEVVFEPLDMQSSTFDYPIADRMQNREAMPHSTEGEPRQPAQDSMARAQGGLMTTTTDMSKLLIELMNTFRGMSARVISKDTLQVMLTKQADVPASVFGFPIGMGLGVFVDGEGNDISLMHPGHNYPGSVFLVLAFPGRGQGMAIGINGNKGDRLEIEAASTLAEIYGWPSGDYFDQEAPEN